MLKMTKFHIFGALAIIIVYFQHQEQRGNMEISIQDVENPQTPLATSIGREFKTLSPLSLECCIYRVPQSLRSVKEMAYTPQVVSIGPLHHGKDGLNAMEEYKMRYLLDYIERTNVSLEDYINIVKDKEPKLRSCYAETIGFTRDEFVKIILDFLVDSAFIIEVLLRNCSEELRKEKHDRIFETPRMFWEILTDLLLLENQLPFFILVDLFDPKKLLKEEFSIIKLSDKLFTPTTTLGGTEENLEKMSSTTIRHFVDFVRNLFVPVSPHEGKECENISIPSMKNLHQAGVKFKARVSKNLLDVHFENGILEIPKFEVQSTTECLIRNLVAYEQCHYQISERYLTDYVVFMDRLVNVPEDEELLVKNKILNLIGDSSKGSEAINNLSSGVYVDTGKFYFAEICKNLSDYYNTPWHRWRANLMQDYFKTPWVTISVIAAVFVIVLTIIQAVCSIISVV